jgi:chorismate dehydratase
MENRKIKVAAVSYLNTKPLLYGFEGSPLMQEMELSVDYPSRIGAQLVKGEVDLGLIPVALIPQLKEYHIVSDYCIGAVGPVASVCLFSDVPLARVTRLYLDYQSRSSVALARFLLNRFWKVSPELVAAAPGYEEEIGGTTAGVVIGDRALRQRAKNRYVYDLAEAWIRHTGLPMVFAAWISNRPLAPEFLSRFNEATGLGTSGRGLEQVVSANPCDFFDLHAYYTRHISYGLTEVKKKGLARFLEVLGEPVTSLQ